MANGQHRPGAGGHHEGGHPADEEPDRGSGGDALKPFLLLASRAEDPAALDEYLAFQRYGGLTADQLHRVRLEAQPMPPIDVRDYSGILVGGSPFTSSDPPESKSAVQVRVEDELRSLLDRVVAADFPFLGACYGVGTLGAHQGAVIDRTYGEPIGPVSISLTPEGRTDPLLEGLPDTFDAYVGHKEACRILPPGAVLLATSEHCPVQMFRIRRNLYATQFHPELDVAGILTRVDVYRYAGYFAPETAEQLMDAARSAVIPHPPRIVRNFVERYARC